ncbi:J domain-containing protein [Breznakiella homolactica]|uniref:J domain-containing protein n=1 Tax=Breznakiella homolactica TaxID=2798577 RepID=A0A7T7XNW2_9SPIR|nr:J domain-containing protein [Breznakiella homolactica]QQO09682.1 J domain-containing protein [Breznakiella homolactica]
MADTFRGFRNLRSAAASLLKKLKNRRFPWLGPLAGGLIGLFGGAAGVIIGIILGYLIRELFGQFKSDRDLLEYLVNPGQSNFSEPDPGMAAYCALGVIIIAKSLQARDRRYIADGSETALKPVQISAAESFPNGGDHAPELEAFCRLAASKADMLNADLLAESLAARRLPFRDQAYLGQQLEMLAFGPGIETGYYIRTLLDPDYSGGGTHENASREIHTEADPWLILGLDPGTPRHEVKSTFRKLAVQFHPDSLQELDKKHQEDAARAFITIKEAYRQIMSQRDSGKQPDPVYQQSSRR